VAGNVGAARLQQAAAAVEAAIRDHGVVDAEPGIAALEVALDEVVQGLDALAADKASAVSAADGPTVETTPVPKPTETADLLAALSALEPHLVSRKPKPSNEAMKQLLSLRWPEGLFPSVEKLAGLVRKYRFKEALEIRNMLADKLRS
jgi:hypothetical protein